VAVNSQASPVVASVASAPRSFWNLASTRERAGYLVGIALLAGGLVHVAILVTGGGSWEGPLSLRKPATFGLSFGLTLITIVWVVRFLNVGARARSVLVTMFTAASVLETALVSLQAWRGVPSHFNVETSFDEWVARGLAGGGVALVVMVGVMTLVSFRANAAIQAGFIALSAAMAIGAVMIGRGMTLVFTGNAPVAYATGGLFKPIHAVTMHGILVLPALAWMLSFADWSEARRVGVIVAAAAAYVVLVATVMMGNIASWF
jgi:hypothetical protein